MAAPAMMLLGAGASVEAGVPATVEMSRRILNSFDTTGLDADVHRILSFAIGGLVFQRGIQGNDPYAGVDVEELFAAVQLLARRTTLEAAPFIGSWHATVEELDRQHDFARRRNVQRVVERLYETTIYSIEKSLPSRASDRSKIDVALAAFLQGKGRKLPSIHKAIEQAMVAYSKEWMNKAKKSRPKTPSFFDRDFARAVESQSTRPGEGGPFAEAAERMVLALSDLVWIPDVSRVQYLEPLAQASHNCGSLSIATLNYDNAVELLGNAYNQPVHRGLGAWSETGKLDLGDSGFRLLKLHGSIDWVLENGEVTSDAPLRRQSVRVASEPELKKQGYRPAVVFGQGSKLTAEGPFLDILHSFRRELDAHERLVVVGYSFRDEHVNEYIAQWVNGSPNRHITVIDPGFRGNSSAFARELAGLGTERVTIIEETASRGLSLSLIAS